MFEPIYTITHFYDGPRRGIAAFRGAPYLYESRFSDLNRNTEDSFFLMPITVEVFELALESWAIWCRWEKAFKQGQTTQDTHPVLPQDAKRHAQLEHKIKFKLRLDKTKTFCAKATFKNFGDLNNPSLMVQWIVVSCQDYLDNRSLVNFHYNS